MKRTCENIDPLYNSKTNTVTPLLKGIAGHLIFTRQCADPSCDVSNGSVFIEVTAFGSDCLPIGHIIVEDSDGMIVAAAANHTSPQIPCDASRPEGPDHDKDLPEIIRKSAFFNSSAFSVPTTE